MLEGKGGLEGDSWWGKHASSSAMGLHMKPGRYWWRPSPERARSYRCVVLGLACPCPAQTSPAFPPCPLQNALTRDVFTQLRTISSQQSKIREMKNKLALFRWVGGGCVGACVGVWADRPMGG